MDAACLAYILLVVFGCFCNENYIWLDLQYCISGFQVTYKSYRQVLTPITNFQLLLKLEILDKLRLVTFHKNTTQRKQKTQHLIGSISIGETGVLMTLNHRA